MTTATPGPKIPSTKAAGLRPLPQQSAPALSKKESAEPQKEDIVADETSPSDDLRSLECVAIADQVLAQYDDWKGVRYRAGGTDRRGVDCSGLVRAVFRDAFRLELPRTSIEQSRLGRAIARQDIQPGDLLYFKDRGYKHVAVAVTERRFLHSTHGRGVILSEFDAYWSKRLLRVRRLLPDS